MSLSALNTLFILEESLRGTPSKPLADVHGLDKTILQAQRQQTVLRAILLTPATADKPATLQLPDGTTFTAQLPANLPAGTRFLLSLQPQGQVSILRTLLPAQSTPNETDPLLEAEQGTSLSPLAKLIATTMARPGDMVKLLLSPGNSTPLPSAGARLMGQIAGPPSGGRQILQLAGQRQLEIPLPPVFEPGAEVTLRIQSGAQAVIVNLRQPGQPAATEQATPAAPASSAGTAAQPRQPEAGSVPYPQLTQTRAAGPQNQLFQNQLAPPSNVAQPPVNVAPEAATQSAMAQPANTVAPQPILQLQLAAPLPATIKPGELYTATVNAPATAGEKPTLTLENGVSLKLIATPQQQLPPNQPMTIRFTSTGLTEVLSSAPAQQPRAVGSRNRDQQQQTGQQQPRQPAPLPTLPETTPEGHLAVGKVVEQRPGGALILSFGNKVQVPVQAQRMLPIGTQVSVRIMPDGHAEIVDLHLPEGTERVNSMMRFSVAWDTLQNAYAKLQHDNPEAAQKLRDLLPRANESLLPRLVDFAQAVTTQKPEHFFGQDILNILKALGLDLRLQQDLSQMAAAQHQQRPDGNTADSWRGLFFPYWDEASQQPRQGSFYWRHQHQEDQQGDDKASEHTRFVVNLDMSQLGSLQLDGLIHGRKMLLKLRSIEDLGEDFRQGLRHVLSTTGRELNLETSIQVETTSFFKVDPLHEMVNTEQSSQINVEV